MKRKKVQSVLAGFVLAAGMMAGLSGCSEETVQESTEVVSVQEPTEVITVPEMTEPVFDINEAQKAVKLWAEEQVESGYIEETGLLEELWKEAVLTYTMQSVGEESAVLRYYVTTTDSGVYVVDETVQIIFQDGEYRLEREALQSYNSIEDRGEFAQLYGKSGICEESTGYNAHYFRSVVRNILEDGASAELYTDPVRAAEYLLHLGPGKGDIARDMTKPEVSSGSWMEELNENVLLEGTTVTVVYTFDKDGTTIEIPMELIEASLGIWAPADGNYRRQVYETYRYWNYFENGESELEYCLQLSNTGIYKIQDGAITCLYPYYVAADTPVCVVNNVLYFVADSTYIEGTNEYHPDCFAMLDMETGEVDMESMKLSRSSFIPMPERLYYEGNGFLGYYLDYKQKHIPVVNVGTADFSGGVCWEGKPVTSLNEQERNAYGSAIRAELLAEPGKVLHLSMRTMTETYAYIDMDGDGVTEKIVLAPQDEERYYDLSFDNYVLSVGDSSLVQWGENVHNDLYAFSMDGKEILILVLEDGPSADDASMLYAYREGKVVKVGQMASHICDGDVKNGRISGSERGDVIQSDYISVYWHIGESGLLEKVPQDSYDYAAQNDIELLVALPVHKEHDLESEKFEIQPQTVKFLKTDSTFSWVYVQAEDGSAGWVYVENFGHIVELGKDYDEVFEGLHMFG